MTNRPTCPANQAQTWRNEFDALSELKKHQVRYCADHFRVPLMHSFLRAKGLGLLDEPERDIAYACEDGHCECGSCPKPEEKTFDALKNLNRATYTTAMFLILLATVLGVIAAGFIREENRLARQAVINQEIITTAKGAEPWH